MIDFFLPDLIYEKRNFLSKDLECSFLKLLCLTCTLPVNHLPQNNFGKQFRFDYWSWVPGFRAEFQTNRPYYVWVINQVWGQDDWILAKFFFRVFMAWDGVKVHKLEDNIQPSWPNKPGLLRIYYMAFREIFLDWTRRVVLSRQDSSILPAWVANHSTGYGLSCPLAEPAIK